tara:strand:+ start:2547 stop:2996 length:450 start_codon:yes stop_codon:yes gene_type:complete
MAQINRRPAAVRRAAIVDAPDTFAPQQQQQWPTDNMSDNMYFEMPPMPGMGGPPNNDYTGAMTPDPVGATAPDPFAKPAEIVAMEKREAARREAARLSAGTPGGGMAGVSTGGVMGAPGRFSGSYTSGFGATPGYGGIKVGTPWGTPHG